MELQTHIDIPQSLMQLSHSDRVVLLGSCFAQGIGVHLEESLMSCMVNPFGVLYNPLSIASALNTLFSSEPSVSLRCGFDKSSGLWFNWAFDTQLSAHTEEECMSLSKARIQEAREFALKADCVVITLGTNRYYSLEDSGLVVANCHKQPQSLFVENDATVEQTFEVLSSAIATARKANPALRFLFTVSPIRYRKYGYHESQLAKSVLLLAVDRLQRELEGVCFYFPAYEIVLDELRDYRFYAPDMIHPSLQAVDYVWSRFMEAHLTPSAREAVADCRRLSSMLSHRVMNEGSDEHRRFLEKTVQTILQLKEKYNYLALDKELKVCLTQLKR